MREGRRIGRSEISSVIMGIKELHPQPNWVLRIVADDGRVGNFDVSPYLEYEAFNELRDHNECMKVSMAAIVLNGNPALICQRIP